MPDPMAPLRDILDRLEQLRRDLTNLHPEVLSRFGGDLAESTRRVVRALEDGETTIEAGCAARVMRIAVALRELGGEHLSVWVLARDLIVRERRPSPDWPTLCTENGYVSEDVKDGPVRSPHHYLVDRASKKALHCGGLLAHIRVSADVTPMDIIEAMQAIEPCDSFARILGWLRDSQSPVSVSVDGQDRPWEEEDGWTVEQAETVELRGGFSAALQARFNARRILELERRLEEYDYDRLSAKARTYVTRLLERAKTTTPPANPADPSGRWGAYRNAMMRLSWADELNAHGDQLTAVLLLRELIGREEETEAHQELLAAILRRHLDDLLGLG